MSIQEWNNVGKNKPTEEDMEKALAIYNARYGKNPNPILKLFAKDKAMKSKMVLEDEVFATDSELVPKHSKRNKVKKCTLPA